MLANLLVYELNRPVIDATGLKGDFAFTLKVDLVEGESDAVPDYGRGHRIRPCGEAVGELIPPHMVLAKGRLILAYAHSYVT